MTGKWDAATSEFRQVYEEISMLHPEASHDEVMEHLEVRTSFENVLRLAREIAEDDSRDTSMTVGDLNRSHFDGIVIIRRSEGGEDGAIFDYVHRIDQIRHFTDYTTIGYGGDFFSFSHDTPCEWKSIL